MQSPVEKQFMPLGGEPLLVRTIRVFDSHPGIHTIHLALSAGRLADARTVFSPFGFGKLAGFVEGGAERGLSVRNAFKALAPETAIVLVHDSVRPFVTAPQVDEVIQAARNHGAASLAVPVSNTIKRAREELAFETVDRRDLWSIQTPQAFQYELLNRALQRAARDHDFGTDECYIVEKLGHSIKLVQGSEFNIKITRPEDFRMAELLLNEKNPVRIGTGYDAHRLVEGRKLVLGGVEFAHPKGLLGHSDADVLCHAIGDAILGAMGEGDLGKWFPDSDERFKGISSLKLLAEIRKIAEGRGLRIGNVDATILAQKPRLSAFFGQMRSNIAEALAIEPAGVSVKATTTEGLGFEGKEEGMSAQAVVALFAK